MPLAPSDRMILSAYLNKIVEGVDVVESIGFAEEAIRNSAKKADAVQHHRRTREGSGWLDEQLSYLGLDTVGIYTGSRKRIKNGAMFAFQKQDGPVVEFYFKRGKYTFEEAIVEACNRDEELDDDSREAFANSIIADAMSRVPGKDEQVRSYDEATLGKQARSVDGYVLERVDMVSIKPRTVLGFELPIYIWPEQERSSYSVGER
jgi:hypothetical protein